jgi:hypothetical protein
VSVSYSSETKRLADVFFIVNARYSKASSRRGLLIQFKTRGILIHQLSVYC